MKILLNIFVFVCATCFLNSCARTYHPIISPKLGFSTPRTSSNETLVYSTRSNALTASRNYRYAKRETKRGYRIFAVQITNTSSQPMYLNNLRYKLGGNEVLPVANHIAVKEIKQNAPVYLLYMLLAPTGVYARQPNPNGGGSQRVYVPVGVVIAPVLTFANLGVAATANKKFRTEMGYYSLENKTLAPGATVYGLVSFKNVVSAEDLQILYVPAAQQY